MYRTPIKRRQPLAVQASNALRDLILQGEFKPGERLNESTLSSKLGISRAPIREGLKVLEAEGLVVHLGQRGTFVKKLSAKEAKEVTAVMSTIQCLTIRYAIEHMDDKKEKELKSIIQQEKKISKLGDVKKSVAAGRAFHRFIVEAAGNDLLMKIHNLCRIQEERYRFLIISEQGIPTVGMDEHAAILEAMLRRNADEAEALLKAHFESACQRTLSVLEGRQKDPIDTRQSKTRKGT